jgi:hypothetical protein
VGLWLVAALAAEARNPLTSVEMRPSNSPWLVTCSCGWGRECLSAWAAESVSRLHQQLGDVGVEHVTQIEAPDDPKSGQQLPLV